LPR
jgi:hypothetical protein